MLKKVREHVLPVLERSGGVRARMIDDTGFPKKGNHSVDVARQYCGQLGKRENCQTAVSLSVANDTTSLPVAYRLYMPEIWARDPERRGSAGVPDDVAFRTKPQIALDQIEAAPAEGIAPGVVLADAGYGNEAAFRERLTELELANAVDIEQNSGDVPAAKGKPKDDAVGQAFRIQAASVFAASRLLRSANGSNAKADSSFQPECKTLKINCDPVMMTLETPRKRQ